MANAPQNFENHARLVKGYHMVAVPILGINFLWSLYRVVTGFSGDTLVAFAVSIALILVALYARVFALTAQDRVIRLEMALRLSALSPDLAAQVDRFTVNQLVSLRFASDDELVGLAREVLAEGLDDRKAIKKRIKNWKADELRV